MAYSDQLQAIIVLLQSVIGSGLAEGINIDIANVNVTVNLEISPPVITNPAVKAVLTIGGNMAGAITVDTTNETVELSFVDKAGDPAAEPTGAVVAFTSDNTAVATVAVDASDPNKGDITPVAIGTANIGATITDASGNPLLEADGTPWAPIASVPVTVSAGAATGADLTLSA